MYNVPWKTQMFMDEISIKIFLRSNKSAKTDYFVKIAFLCSEPIDNCFFVHYICI